VLKKDLTGPTLLEMYEYGVTQDFALSLIFSRRRARANGLRGQRRWFVKNLD